MRKAIDIDRDQGRQRESLPEISTEMLQAMRRLREDVEREHKSVKEPCQQTCNELKMEGIAVEYSMTNEIGFISKKIVIRFAGHDISRIHYRDKLPVMLAVYDIFLTSGIQPASILEKRQQRDEIVFVYRDE